MFASHTGVLYDGRVSRTCITRDADPLLYADVVRLWQDDAAFRLFFIALLSDAPFPVYRWETPPVTTGTLHREFEFVLLDSPGLAMTPDSTAFEDRFRAADAEDGVIAFPNLGRDALLVVPTPLGQASTYGHLAAFVRHAPDAQNHALWRMVGRTLQQRMSDQPVWVSTAGGGVSWLHVRLDSRPKYYGYRPYTETA